MSRLCTFGPALQSSFPEAAVRSITQHFRLSKVRIADKATFKSLGIADEHNRHFGEVIFQQPWLVFCKKLF